MRQLLDQNLDTIGNVDEPTRFSFTHPRDGGPTVAQIRAVLTLKGRLRMSGTALRIFGEVTPRDPERVLVALDTIARDDAMGLERMLLSALPYVDEIVIGVDGRSDPETVAIARMYADCTFKFEAKDIGLSAEAWEANKIDFSAARNLGRRRVHAPWTLVVDTDEYIRDAEDLRALVGKTPVEQGMYRAIVAITDAGKPMFEQRDFQRLARTEYRWQQATHNQLVCLSTIPPKSIRLVIVSDNSMRDPVVQERRNAQRDQGVEDLAEDAMRGQMDAFFHLAKHKAAAGDDIAEAVGMVEEFRARVVPNTVRVEQRQWLALALGFRFHREGDLLEANRWACRALLDGPSVSALCLLGDVAQQAGDIWNAVRWYQAACAVDLDDSLGWPVVTDRRQDRLEELLLLLAASQDHHQHQAAETDTDQQKV